MLRWNEVTWYSKLGAVIVIFVILPALSFYIGVQYDQVMHINNAQFSANTPQGNSSNPLIISLAGQIVNSEILNLPVIGPALANSPLFGQAIHSDLVSKESNGALYTRIVHGVELVIPIGSLLPKEEEALEQNHHVLLSRQVFLPSGRDNTYDFNNEYSISRKLMSSDEFPKLEDASSTGSGKAWVAVGALSNSKFDACTAEQKSSDWASNVRVELNQTSGVVDISTSCVAPPPPQLPPSMPIDFGPGFFPPPSPPTPSPSSPPPATTTVILVPPFDSLPLTPVTYPDGTVHQFKTVTWEQAQVLIKACQVNGGVEAFAGNFITLRNGTYLLIIGGGSMGQMLSAAAMVKDKCGSMPSIGIE